MVLQNQEFSLMNVPVQNLDISHNNSIFIAITTIRWKTLNIVNAYQFHL